MASGNTLCVFDMGASRPPTGNFATPDTRNAHLVMNYVNGSSTYTTFEGVLPRNYSNNGITVYLTWLALSVNTGSVQWAVAFERHQANVTLLTSDQFATEQSANQACAGTNGEVVQTSIAFTDGTQINNIAQGESFRIKVRRDGANANDTMSDKAQLLKVELKET